MSSGGWLILVVVGPGRGLVVESSGLQTAVQDAGEAVGQLAEGSVVPGSAGAQLVVVGAGARGGPQRAEGLLVQGVGEPPVAHVPGEHHRLLARGAGDRGLSA